MYPGQKKGIHFSEATFLKACSLTDAVARSLDAVTVCTSKRVCILSLFLSLSLYRSKFVGQASALPVCLVTEIMASRRQTGRLLVDHGGGPKVLY